MTRYLEKTLSVLPFFHLPYFSLPLHPVTA